MPPPETPEPQEADYLGKAGRGYGKWGEEEEKLLVQLWCDKHTRLESRHQRQVWEEIALEISKIRQVTSAQCQRKMKYLKDRYKETKIHFRNKTGGERKTSPFYDEIDSALGCRDIVTFSHIEESAPGSSSSSPNSNEKEGGPEDEGSVDKEQFEQSLAAFGLKRRKERKRQRDKRKRTESAEAQRKEQEEGDALFCESMKKLREQGDKISGVLESSTAAPAHESI